MIFAVLDPSPLTVCINCSFFTFIVGIKISLGQVSKAEGWISEHFELIP